MSRLRFLFTFVAVFALAAALGACGGSGSDKSGESPQTVVDEATLQGVESGNLELAVDVDASGQEGGSVSVDLSGPFQSGAKGKLPLLDLTAKVDGSIGGEDVSFDGGLTLLPNSAYVDYEGTEYEVDPTTFSFVESALEQAQGQGGGEAAGATACQEEAGKLKVADFVEGLSNEGSADVGGTSTTKVSGDLNVAGAIDAFVELTEGPACKAQIAAAGPLPSKSEIEQAKGEVEQSLKSAHVDVYVGDDDIVRQVSAQLTIEPQGSGSGPKSISIDADLKLTGVNEEQEISAPGKSKPISDLFIKLGINPIELLGMLQGEAGSAGGAEGLGDLLEGLGRPGEAG
ncbi:MAG TPA: hypothetical protein VHQ43_05530 [Solirubrobacterales bacterium]|nr:hypothetical protein [Solirubrobacterales bacterium]